MKAINMLRRMRFKNTTGAKVNALPNCALFLSKVKVAFVDSSSLPENAKSAKIQPCQDIKKFFL